MKIYFKYKIILYIKCPYDGNILLQDTNCHCPVDLLQATVSEWKGLHQATVEEVYMVVTK